MKRDLSFVLVECTFSFHPLLCFSILRTIHLNEVSPFPHLKLGIFVDNTNHDESIKKNKKPSSHSTSTVTNHCLIINKPNSGLTEAA